jgi:hypothetical protein
MTDREVVELQAQRQGRPTLVLSRPVSEWTPVEILDEMKSGSQLGRARSAFYSAVGLQEQELQQRKPPGPIELRRMEFQAVIEIAKALGLEIAYKSETETEAPTPGPGNTANE